MRQRLLKRRLQVHVIVTPYCHAYCVAARDLSSVAEGSCVGGYESEGGNVLDSYGPTPNLTSRR
jgi:hypothetical protein